MADSSSSPELDANLNAATSNNGERAGNDPLYWCYQCSKEVSVQAEDGNTGSNSSAMVCTECQSGFIEAMSSAQPDLQHTARRRRRRGTGHAGPQAVSLSDALEHLYPQQLVHLLQLIGQAARSNNLRHADAGDNNQAPTTDAGPDARVSSETTTPNQTDERQANENEPLDGLSNGGHLLIVRQRGPIQQNEGEDDGSESEGEGMRLELEGWDSADDDDEEEWEEVEEDEDGGETEEGADTDVAIDNGQLAADQPGHEHRRRSRQDAGNLRIEGRNTERSLHQYLQELLRDLVGHNIEVRLELPEGPMYVGNPGDYVDARGFEQLLQQLAENDNSRRGAPPAAKSAVESLPSVLIDQSHVNDGMAVCAICKDIVALGEPAKQLPCLHLYHQDCILPWLNARNSCPVCRYELPTDDPEYEEQKQSRCQTLASQHMNQSGEQTSEESSQANESSSNPPNDELSEQVSSASEGAEENSQLEAESTGTVEEPEENESSIHSNGRSRSTRGRGWFFLAAGPVLSMMGLVLVICLRNHLIGNQLHNQQHEFFQEPCIEQMAGSSESHSRRRWWMPFQRFCQSILYLERVPLEMKNKHMY